ncbi:hypothetical protein H072_7234 [Dactylellina haptotyla CBS 200.50]|uniref:Uncharacterized protein n=1 Tax=Dactylellina haptotyla (strain CBS 200.50) TaxID=1284197 RepID=S8BI76_DACHA|nr:hypothetical protein H072_7234 [Dactylellina haptotyla CBS 200.50]
MQLFGRRGKRSLTPRREAPTIPAAPSSASNHPLAFEAQDRLLRPGSPFDDELTFFKKPVEERLKESEDEDITSTVSSHAPHHEEEEWYGGGGYKHQQLIQQLAAWHHQLQADEAPVLPFSQSRLSFKKQSLHRDNIEILSLSPSVKQPEEEADFVAAEEAEDSLSVFSSKSIWQPSEAVNRSRSDRSVLSGATLRPEPESRKARERRAAALDWLSTHKKVLDGDRHINSFDKFTEFLDCAYTVFQAGKSGWDANCPADHFASTIDQATNSNFKDDLIQSLLNRHHQRYNVVAEMDGSGSTELGPSSALLPAMPTPPPAAIAPPSEGPQAPTEPPSGPSLFQKDIFLDWHSKFAFSSPVRLGSKEVLPTIQLSIFSGRSDEEGMPTAAPSQELQPLDKNEGLDPQHEIVETPHPETYQPHPGLIELGRSLYTPRPQTFLSDSPLNMPRPAENKPTPLPAQQSSSSPPPPQQTNMQLFEPEEESYVFYGNSNLQGAILSGEVDAHRLLDEAQHEEENSIQVLGPMVEAAILKGHFDIVVQLVQRNPECIDVALAVAEANGKFAPLKFLGMLKEHYRRSGHIPGGQFGGFPGYGVGSGPSSLGVPYAPPRPRSRGSDHGTERSSHRGRTSRKAHRSPAGRPEASNAVQPQNDDLAVDADDSEEVWKLRAIYLLILMIALSESTSTDGWDSMSTASSSRQSSQAPVDSGEHSGGAHGASSRGLGLSSGPSRARQGGGGGGGDKKKRPQEDDSDESEGKDRRGPNRRRRGDLRSLGRRFACPFAKAEPDHHVTCWTINRQNLAGVKEHLKRFHCGGTLPSDIRAARTWDEVFDVIAPDWGNKPRPSPYVDMLDIFQRSVRPPPSNPGSSAASVAYGSMDGLASPQQQWTQYTTGPSINTGIQPTAFSPDLQQLSPDALNAGAYNMSLGPNLLYPNAQQNFRQVGRADTPGSASAAGFEGVNYAALQNQPINTTSLSALNLQATSHALSPVAGLGSNLPFDDFINQLAAPHFTGISTQELNDQYTRSGEFYWNEYGLDMTQPAGTLFTGIMDIMEPVASIPGLAPVYEGSSPEPDSAVSNETINTLLYQQQQHIPPAAPTPSIISSSNVSVAGASAYPSSSTSMGIHNTMAPAQPNYHTPGSVAATTPIHISHASSPPSATGATRDRKLQLLISRNPAISPSTEAPGHRTFIFDSHEDFVRNFDVFMKTQFNDPGFNWEGWELMNPITRVRLPSAEAVFNDADFTFLAHARERAALYLVPKDL